MAVSLKHAKTSAVADGGNTDLVQPSDWNSEHTLTLSTDKLLGRTTDGTGAVEEVTCTDFAQSLLNDADAATARTTLGLGTMATETATDYLTTAAASATYQPLDADLTAWAAVNPSSYSTTAQIAAAYQPLDSDLTAIAALTTTAFGRALLTEASAASTRTTLGLGTMALETATNYLTIAAAAAGYQPLDSDLTAIAALSTTSFGRSLLTEATAASAFSTLKQAATDSATGVVELATTTEVQTGTDTTRVVTPAGLRAATREKLTANRTYYVRTDGSDSNTGLANTAGGAFLTLQKAIDVAVTLDLAGYSVTIQVGNGTYTAGVNLTTPFVGGLVTLQGDTTTPSNVVISVTAGNCIALSGSGVRIDVRGFKFSTTTSGDCIQAYDGASCNVGGTVDFGSCAGSHIAVSAGAGITIASVNYTISSGATTAHVVATTGRVLLSGGTVTLSGTPAFTYFVVSQSLGYVQGTGTTYSGSATGSRYVGTTNAVINTFGGGANYFPGSTAGSTFTGAQYA